MASNKSLFPGDKYITGSSFESRFHYEIPSIIGNAIEHATKELRESSCRNLLAYYKEAVSLGNPIRPEVVQYLHDAIEGLSSSERERTAGALSIRNANYDIADILSKLNEISPKAEQRLIEKLTAVRGQPRQSDNQEKGRIRYGAEVYKLCGVYCDKESVESNRTKQLGFEPLERAIREVSDKYSINYETVRRSYKLYRQYHEWGCVDDTGKFIIHDYNWLFSE